MKYKAIVGTIMTETGKQWVARSMQLKGCVGQGDTEIEALKELENNEKEWLEAAKDNGIDIPENSK